MYTKSLGFTIVKRYHDLISHLIVKTLELMVSGTYQVAKQGKVYNKKFDVVYIVSPSLKTAKEDPLSVCH